MCTFGRFGPNTSIVSALLTYDKIPHDEWYKDYIARQNIQQGEYRVK